MNDEANRVSVGPPDTRIGIRAAAAVCAALAAWLSRGALAFTDGDTLHRIGLLPPLWQLAAFALLFLAVVLVCRTTSACLPLLFSFVLMLPWVPLPWRAPASFLVWTGNMTVAVWIAIAVAMFVTSVVPLVSARLRARLAEGRHAPWLAFVLAFLFYGLAIWHMSPNLPTGDEPEYLVITQSVLLDRDLQTQNNYQRGDYRDYTPVAAQPVPDYLNPGKNGRLYSIHMPGLPVLIAPAFAVGGYPAVALLLALLAAATTALAWTLAFNATEDAAAAWFGWATVALTAPFFFHAFAIYPDAPAAALLLFVVWHLNRYDAPRSPRQLLVLGVTLAIFPWLVQRFSVFAATFGICLMLRMWRTHAPRRSYTLLLLVPAISAIAWFDYFWTIYGSVSPWSPYGSAIHTFVSARYIPGALSGILFDQQFGLLPSAPIFVVPLVGLVWSCRRRQRAEGAASLSLWSRVAIEFTCVFVIYLLNLSTWESWWGASGVPPARFLVPVIPALAVPTAIAWTRTRNAAMRACMIAALTVSLMITLALLSVDNGRMAFNNRLEPWDLMLDWLTPLVDLTGGLPSALRDAPTITLSKAAIWIVCIWATTLIARRTTRRSPGAIALTTSLSIAVAMMSALEGTWWISGVPAKTPASAQEDLLGRFDADRASTGIRYRPLRFVAASAVPTEMRLERVGRPLHQRQGSLMTIGHTPAGAYALVIEATVVHSGTLTLMIAPGWWPIRSFALDQSSTTRIEQFQLPVSVAGLALAGDANASQSVKHVTLRPIAIAKRGEHGNLGLPKLAMRYASSAVYFMDGTAYVESTGFWIPPDAETWVVFESRPDSEQITLAIRNVPLPNQLAIATDEWRQTLNLAPGERRSVTVPTDRTHLGTLVHFHAARGMRSPEVKSSLVDDQTVGVRVEVVR